MTISYVPLAQRYLCCDCSYIDNKVTTLQLIIATVINLAITLSDHMWREMRLREMKGKKVPPRANISISGPDEFRVVSAIVDADLLPDTVRRVKLLKHTSDRPLGFYIRDGTSVRVTPYGLEKVPGIFISRLVPGGLAEGTGLLAVNDEILEVNGIEVIGKSLDQVTDMMVANSQNLIITVKPASQPPSTPRTQPVPVNKSAQKFGGSLTVAPGAKSAVGSVAKSYGDLPSVTAVPPTSKISTTSTNGPLPGADDESSVGEST